MNGSLYSHDPSNECYTGNNPPTFTPNSTNIHLRHSDSRSTHENVQLRQIKQLNTVKQRHSYMINCQQQQREPLNLNRHSFQNSEASTAYYDRIRAQVFPKQSSPLSSRRVTRSRETSPVKINDQPQQNPIFTTTNNPVHIFPKPQPTTPNSKSIADHPSSIPLRNNDDLPLDYLNYTMDSLIQQLVPSDTYKPKESFLYPMFMCSRLHIRPSVLLNKLSHLTINSITYMTHDRGVRTMQNFLYVLSQWTRTFPYDFRNTEMISQLNELLRKIISYNPALQSDADHIDKKLRSKLKALETYEEYIRQLTKKALHVLSQMALFTDIINECPTSKLFAQQLTCIELDRLKPIGAEELIQYFIMKSASEEARAHPTRTHNNQTTTSNNKSLNVIHDTKLTFCLETYIQWFNRLTFFVTTEIVKHTQRRLRIRLINYFIDAAYECLRLHNFNSMIGIIGGLNMQPVKRLKRTWEKIQLEKLEQLDQYTNPSRNFANYRRILKTAMEETETHRWGIDKIVVPFTSIMLQDIYFIKTHSKDDTPTGGINLQKYYSMAKFILDEFVQCKQSKCSFERNDVIINYIITSPAFNEESLMLASFECEPPTTANEKVKLSLLQASVNTPSSKSYI